MIGRVISSSRIFSCVVAVFVAVLSGCMAQRRSSVAYDAQASGLSLKGVAALPSGVPVANADVFFDTSTTPVAKTGADGGFFISMTDSEVSKFSANLIAGRSNWHIYARQSGGIALSGISLPVSSIQRGDVSLGTITLNPVTTLIGRVLKASGNQTEPAVGATVEVGFSRIQVDNNGKFVANNLPSGQVPISIVLPKTAGFSSYLEVAPGALTELDTPFILFQDSKPNAVVIPKPWIEGAKDNWSLTTRNFAVIANSSAKYIRYSHSLDDVRLQPGKSQNQTTQVQSSNDQGRIFSQSSTPIAQWKDISDSITYSFPSEGAATLWYQVADSTKEVVSDIAQVNLNINSCSGVGQLIVGDGSPVVTSRRTQVQFQSLPSNAVKVRFGEDLSILDKQPWRQIAPTMDYLFDLTMLSSRSNDGSQFSTQKTRQVYAEIATTSGECPIISGKVDLVLFPESQDMFRINGGAAMSQSRIVQVDIPVIPPNAFEMRLFEENNTTGWLRVSPATVFMFLGTGTKILNLQFRDADRIESPVYVRTIDIRQSESAGFQLSFVSLNAPVPNLPAPPSRYILMQFIPPQNALAFRWIELLSDGGNSNMGGVGTSGTAGDYATDPNDILNYPWQNLIPYLPVYARGIGMRTYMVQYQTVDGIISTITNSIFIPQLQETVGNFTINNGETTTLFPTVQLQVFPPVNAVAMSATNLTLQQTTANSSTVFNFGQISASTSSSSNDQWLAPAPEIAFKLDSRGAQSIQMRFRDPNGDVVQPAVVKTVIYDPFPPFPVGVPPLTINSGAASTTSSLVTLNIKFPESAHSFRVSQDPNFVNVDEFLEIPSTPKSTLAGVTWKIYEFNTPYILSGAAGPKIVYVQARNELGDRSAVYSALIDYTP